VLILVVQNTINGLGEIMQVSKKGMKKRYGAKKKSKKYSKL